MFDLKKNVNVNYDPGLWESINDTKVVMLVKRGIIKILKENYIFPKEQKCGRDFCSKHIYDHPNSEK